METITSILTTTVRIQSVGIFYKKKILTNVAERLVKIAKTSVAFKKANTYCNEWLQKQLSKHPKNLQSAFLTYKRLLLPVHDATGIPPLFMGLVNRAPPPDCFQLLMKAAKIYYNKWISDDGKRWMEVVLYLVMTLQQMNAKSKEVAELKRLVRARVLSLIEQKHLFSKKGWEVISPSFSLSLCVRLRLSITDNSSSGTVHDGPEKCNPSICLASSSSGWNFVHFMEQKKSVVVTNALN